MYNAGHEAGITYELRANQYDDGGVEVVPYGLKVIGSLHEVFHPGEGLDSHRLDRTLSQAELRLTR